MTGFIRIVSVQRFVSVKMVIADHGGAPPPPFGSYPSNFPNGFGSYPSNFSNGFTSVPFSNGFTSVPVSRPQFYTQTWQEEYSEEEVDLAVQVNGDSGNNALHKCYKFLADWFHKFYGNFKGFVYDFKQFLADWFDQFLDNFVIFLNDFKYFLYNLEHYIDRSTVFIEHCTEFINSLNRRPEEILIIVIVIIIITVNVVGALDFEEAVLQMVANTEESGVKKCRNCANYVTPQEASAGIRQGFTLFSWSDGLTRGIHQSWTYSDRGVPTTSLHQVAKLLLTYYSKLLGKAKERAKTVDLYFKHEF
nr:hypothetical protein Iba_chr06aCG12450 [Ipomoea batatas]